MYDRIETYPSASISCSSRIKLIRRQSIARTQIDRTTVRHASCPNLVSAHWKCHFYDVRPTTSASHFPHHDRCSWISAKSISPRQLRPLMIDIAVIPARTGGTQRTELPTRMPEKYWRAHNYRKVLQRKRRRQMFIWLHVTNKLFLLVHNRVSTCMMLSKGKKREDKQKLIIKCVIYLLLVESVWND